jgi:hypothetical protein
VQHSFFLQVTLHHARLDSILRYGTKRCADPTRLWAKDQRYLSLFQKCDPFISTAVIAPKWFPPFDLLR